VRLHGSIQDAPRTGYVGGHSNQSLIRLVSDSGCLHKRYEVPASLDPSAEANSTAWKTQRSAIQLVKPTIDVPLYDAGRLGSLHCIT